MAFLPIPVTRRQRSVRPVTAAATKGGDIRFILSPAFFAEQPVLTPGSRVLVSYDAEVRQLCLSPAKERQGGARTLRPRPSLPGGATLVLPAPSLPEGLCAPVSRLSLDWRDTPEGAVILDLHQYTPTEGV